MQQEQTLLRQARELCYLVIYNKELIELSKVADLYYAIDDYFSKENRDAAWANTTETG